MALRCCQEVLEEFPGTFYCHVLFFYVMVITFFLIKNLEYVSVFTFVLLIVVIMRM